ncbi:MAG: hypothetical protein H0U41_08280 [Actinobacteria bacterium]|nr:hypothetical protein [Actinomycetota bacterium]
MLRLAPRLQSASIAVFGLANVVAVAFLMWMRTEELTSLWCFWAAVASVAIAVHLRSTNRARAAGSAGSARAMAAG